MCELNGVPENTYCVVRSELNKDTENHELVIDPLYVRDSNFATKYITDYRDAIEACRQLDDKKYFLVQLKGIMSNNVVNSFDNSSNRK